jgi:hypothetical protein
MNHQLCRVSIEEAAHDRPAGKYQRALAEKTQDLLDGRFDPWSRDNFMNLFSADLGEQDMKALLPMFDAAEVGNAEQVLDIFNAARKGFYTRLAQIEAQDQIDNADCRQCYDSGCASCFEPEVE